MMIGPRRGTTACPWCQGTGEDHTVEHRIWSEVTRTYRTLLHSVPCDGCFGTGTVTRKAARQMREGILPPPANP